MPSNSKPPASDERFGTIVHRCTRADLLDFGDLVDVSLPAFCVGFKLPVAVSRAVWVECVAPYEACIEQPGGQAGAIRLSTLLFAAVDAARKNQDKAELLFSFALKRSGKAPKRKKLKLICSAGDHGEPMLTVLDRYED
ncbi:hypothetical protein E5CHR_03734 [Variovorax sp. PBL-E5]|nr:hypothetical protein E5CHR_03734 [Variovorax sp. PBL-E5]